MTVADPLSTDGADIRNANHDMRDDVRDLPDVVREIHDAKSRLLTFERDLFALSSKFVALPTQFVALPGEFAAVRAVTTAGPGVTDAMSFATAALSAVRNDRSTRGDDRSTRCCAVGSTRDALTFQPAEPAEEIFGQPALPKRPGCQNCSIQRATPRIQRRVARTLSTWRTLAESVFRSHNPPNPSLRGILPWRITRIGSGRRSRRASPLCWSPQPDAAAAAASR